MRNKRGDEKYYIIISLILGLMVMFLALYFIFQEFFIDETSREVCRQSIILRANAPEVKKFGVNFVSFKDDYPLRCETEVVEVKKKDIEADKKEEIERKVGRIIGDKLVECWSLFGDGDFQAFPSSNSPNSFCTPCARIYLSVDAREYLKEKGINRIDVENFLKTEKFDKVSYFSYLNGVGEKFAAFNPAFSGEFEFGDSFGIIEDNCFESIQTRGGKEKEEGGGFCQLTLPKYFDFSKGDLVINYGSLTFTTSLGDSGFGWLDALGPIGVVIDTVTDEDSKIGYVPYLFYYTYENKSVLEKTEKKFFDVTYDADRYNTPLCKYWDGIPA